MSTIMLTGPKEKLQLLEKVAQQMGVAASEVDEDTALGLLANKVKTGKTTSKATILKKLRSIESGESLEQTKRYLTKGIPHDRKL